MRHLDLFSGIGGFSLALDNVYENNTHIFVEYDPFRQEVLKKHWPEAPIYGDIKRFSKEQFITDSRKQKLGRLPQKPWQEGDEIGHVDLLTGGFPCQPFSQAGQRRGEADDRFLWPEMCRVIGEFNPQWVIAENVRGLLTQGGGLVFERVCTDLEGLGYEVQPIIIPAVAVGAPHRRDRIWFIAHRRQQHGGKGRDEGMEKDKAERASRIVEGQQCDQNATNPKGKRSSKSGKTRGEASSRSPQRGGLAHNCGWDQNWLEVAAELCRVDDGLPRRMDRNPRLKALGDAIIPQVAEEIFRAINLANQVRNEG